MSDPASNEESAYYQYQLPYAGLIYKISLHVRMQMFESFMKVAKPTADTRVLDIGVTSDRRKDSNFFESVYPYPEKITAVGLEDASNLEIDYPGVKFVKADALNLPFEDKSFDLVVSWAVIEHIGSRANQRAFLSEMSRVGHSYYVTTPNRWYPVEFHTVVPLLHWLPAPTFRRTIKALGKPFYASEETLNLLSEKELIALLPPHKKLTKLPQRLLGPVSNLAVHVE